MMITTPRRREGSPRRRAPRCGHARLGEPEDSEGGLFGPPRQGVARLSIPLCLGGGGLRLGVPTTA